MSKTLLRHGLVVAAGVSLLLPFFHMLGAFGEGPIAELVTWILMAIVLVGGGLASRFFGGDR